MAERYEVVDASPAEQPQLAAFGKRELLYWLAGMLVGLLILAGMWWGTRRASTGEPQMSELRPAPAPNFTLKALDGSTISLSDYQGKVVLLNFWATWCVPCREETPDLQAIYQQLKDEGLVIIGVDQLNTERGGADGLQDVRQFAARFGVSYPIALDETGSVALEYANAPIPTSYMIDRNGRLRFVRVGKLSQQTVERVFRRLRTEP